jgi:hypothetical protein
MGFICDMITGYHDQEAIVEQVLDTAVRDEPQQIERLSLDFGVAYRAGMKVYNKLHPGKSTMAMLLTQRAIGEDSYGPAYSETEQRRSCLGQEVALRYS